MAALPPERPSTGRRAAPQERRPPRARLPTQPGWVLLPLRLFLGTTFAFAGLQKLSDANFFRASASSSIQSQLKYGAHHAPIHGLLAAATHVAVPVGLAIASGELAVGIGTLIGLWTRLAAAGGMLLSLTFLLSVSWHTHPYYLGPDIVFLFAWTPLLIAGGSESWSVDAAVRTRAMGLAAMSDGGSAGDAEFDRRVFLDRVRVGAEVAFVTLLVGAVTAVAGRRYHGRSPIPEALSGPFPSTTVAPETTLTTTPTETTGAPASSVASTTTLPSGPPGTTLIGDASVVPLGQAVSFTDPASGDPAFVLQPRAGRFVAFDARCTHQGCPVNFSPSDHTFVCPCHGAVFEAETGAVLQGPAVQPLNPIKITEQNSYLYADG